MSEFKVSIFCPYCQLHTSLRMAPAEYTNALLNRKDYTAALWAKSFQEKWWIGVCNYCDQPVLVLNQGESVFPLPLPSKTDDRIPKDIREDLIEAKLCFSVRAYRACAVMARRCMQSTCLDKGATKKDLRDQLNELSTNGIITRELKEWADVVRWVGNDAAHSKKDVVTLEDAEDILKLSEQFLHVIYVAPAIAKERKTKRGK
jgi:hypothetical protein